MYNVVYKEYIMKVKLIGFFRPKSNFGISGFYPAVFKDVEGDNYYYVTYGSALKRYSMTLTQEDIDSNREDGFLIDIQYNEDPIIIHIQKNHYDQVVAFKIPHIIENWILDELSYDAIKIKDDNLRLKYNLSIFLVYDVIEFSEKIIKLLEIKLLEILSKNIISNLDKKIVDSIRKCINGLICSEELARKSILPYGLSLIYIEKFKYFSKWLTLLSMQWESVSENTIEHHLLNKLNDLKS